VTIRHHYLNAVADALAEWQCGGEQLKQLLLRIPLTILKDETRLSRHAILERAGGRACAEIASDSTDRSCAIMGNGGRFKPDG